MHCAIEFEPIGVDTKCQPYALACTACSEDGVCVSDALVSGHWASLA